MKYPRLLSSLLLCLIAWIAIPAHARVVRFVVEERTPVESGATWGSAGAYEKLIGTAYMEVDPHHPLNALIVNLDKAPRNERGRVEFSAPFVILKPVDMKRGNRKLWYGVNNRGYCIELGFHAFPMPPGDKRTCNPTAADQIGASNNLFKEGFTWVDAGWHGDGVPLKDRSRLFPTFPVAKNADGSAIVATHRVELSLPSASFTSSLVPGFRPYETADVDPAHATLTVRDRADGPRTLIPADRWSFAVCPEGISHQVASAADLCLFDGFQPRKIYELTYRAKDPIVMGLAYAVTRDIASFLRNRLRDDAGNLNPLAMGTNKVGLRRAYVSGTSSTGMYLREFLYLGFNEDEAHRKVFDGAAIYSAGSHRLFANVQFASPTRYSGQDQHHDYTSNSIPPFTFAVTTDPVTGIRDGILKRPATDPYVVQMDEELVFWQWKAALNVVDSLGNPLPIPKNIRLYNQNGWGHIGATGLLAPPKEVKDCAHPFNGTDGTPLTARAMVKILDEWADRGIAPPPNRYPLLQDGTLVSLADYRKQFPAIPGLTPPSIMNELTSLDFGPDFTATGGIQTSLPPRTGARYTVLVPAPGPDGSAVAGIDTIFTRAPLGTNVGWNLKTPPRDPDLCSLSGSYKPLAADKAQRLADGDSRPSLEERYRNHPGFVQAVKKATAELVSERFMLPEDAQRFVEAAESSDVLTKKVLDAKQ